MTNPKVSDLEKIKFGKLLVLKLSHIDKNKRRFWRCQCDCGKFATISTSNLMSGNSRSCGCSREVHLMSNTRPYNIWRSMKTRCSNSNNPNFSKYGAIGIMFDRKWDTFTGFWGDMQEGYDDKKTLERSDNSKGYNKNNCVWASYAQQNNNRPSCNVLLNYNGETKTVSEWAKFLGVSRGKIYRLKKKGLPDNEILCSL